MLIGPTICSLLSTKKCSFKYLCPYGLVLTCLYISLFALSSFAQEIESRTIRSFITADTRISQYSDAEKKMNFGGDQVLSLWSADTRRILLKSDINHIPNDVEITKVELNLYIESIKWPSNPGLRIFRVLNDWKEGDKVWGEANGVTWYERDFLDHNASSLNNWDTLGGDFDQSTDYGYGVSGLIASLSLSKVPLEGGQWVKLDVSDIVKQWHAGTVENYGLMILGMGRDSDIRISSREHPNLSQRPFFEISYKGGDNQAPEIVRNLTAHEDSGKNIELSWLESYDNIAVTGYEIYRDGIKIGTSTTTSYRDSENIVAGETYVYMVKAFDALGNLSQPSEAFLITTKSPIIQLEPSVSDIKLIAPIVADTLISQYNHREKAMNFGGAATLRTWDKEIRRVLLKGDLSAVPAEAVLTKAKLNLYIENIKWPNNPGLRVFRLLSEWHEGTRTWGGADGATWYETDFMDHAETALNDWDSPGGDYDQATEYGLGPNGLIAQVQGIEAGQWVKLDITEVVEQWLSGVADNYGLMLMGIDKASDILLSSTENPRVSQHPYMEIHYALDTQAPSVIKDLSGAINENGYTELSWSASSDNIAVAGYEIYRDNKKIATSTSTTYIDGEKLLAGKSYVYKVKAYDEAGNVSEFSNKLKIKTPYREAQLKLSQDTYISNYAERYREYNFGGATILKTWQGDIRRVLLYKDLSYVPPGIHVNKAELNLYVTKIAYGAKPSLSVYRLLKPWREGSRTWGSTADGVTWYETDFFDHQQSAKNNWTVPGGDYDQTTDYGYGPNGMIGTAPIQAGQWVKIDITAAVNQWLNGSVGNHGLLVLGAAGGNDINIASKENADVNIRPFIELTYGETEESGSTENLVFFDSQAPDIVSDLNVVLGQDNALQLSWNETDDNIAVAGYVIFRNGVEIGFSTEPYYIDTDTSESSTYTYTVRAVDRAENFGEWSTAVTVTTPTSGSGVSTADAIRSLSTKLVASDVVHLAWNTPADYRGKLVYSVYRDGDELGTTTASGYIDKGVSTDQNYLYHITAKDYLGVALEGSASIRVSTHNAPNINPSLDLENFRIPLTVHERSGVDRLGAVVSSGVPFPVGVLKNIEHLSVVDENGNALPTQAYNMVKWHKPSYDDSVQWALVSFVCDVPANSQATYYLVNRGNTQQAKHPISLSETHSDIAVDIAGARFVIPKQGKALIKRAYFNNAQVIGGEGLQGKIKSGVWTDRGLNLGDIQIAHHKQVVIEEQGPLRTVIYIDGDYTPGDKENKYYGFNARLYFQANSPAVKIVFTLKNADLDPTLVPAANDKAWRHVYHWPIEDASLTADLTLEEGRATTLTANGELSGQQLHVYQDSSGGDKWQVLGGTGYEKWLSANTDGKSVRGVSFRGYRVHDGETLIDAGNMARGVSDIADADKGLSVALRNFRVQYPSALEVSSKQLRVGLFPEEFSEPFHLNHGQRKTWEVTLNLHDHAHPDLAGEFAKQDARLLFRPDPRWVVKAAKNGAWPSGLALVDDWLAGDVRQKMDKDMLDGIHTGHDWFGWIKSFNSGGKHWNQNSTLSRWLLFGDGFEFDQTESRAFWASDEVSWHYDDPDLSAWWYMLKGWPRYDEIRFQPNSYPGYYNRDAWGQPDDGHMGMFMWAEYYFVTGDRRMLKAMEHHTNIARAELWQWTHEDVTDGTGPLAYPDPSARQRDPDREPDFRLATRYPAWPLYVLAQGYQVLGDQRYLDEAQIIAGAFRNTARWSPVGLMTLQINEVNDTSVYGFQGPFCHAMDNSVSQVYANFQQSIMASALAQYYMVSRDQEALDALVAYADHLIHHAMIKDREGNDYGWTYVTGDLWGPFTVEQALDCDDDPRFNLRAHNTHSFGGTHFRLVQPLGYAYQFTGRQDYLSVLNTAAALQTNVNATLATRMAVLHPKADAIAPAAIEDLKATVLGAGQVKLTWTAPGDDGSIGRASRYQIKYSSADIVERVASWPQFADRPQSIYEWEDKAAAFNAQQRAYWAADNIKNAITPQWAGFVEETVMSLPSGIHYIAIKTWDKADNISELSNVVRVEVK